MVLLQASQDAVRSGEVATLTWSSTNATACVATGGWNGSLPTSGSAQTAALTATTSFVISCEGVGGTAHAVAEVVATRPPPSLTLTAAASRITAGNSATLTWSSVDATQCLASGAWSGVRAASGSESTAALTASNTYDLVCSGPGGTSQLASVTIEVAPALQAPASVASTASPDTASVSSTSSGGSAGGGGAIGWLECSLLGGMLLLARVRVRPPRIRIRRTDR